MLLLSELSMSLNLPSQSQHTRLCKQAHDPIHGCIWDSFIAETAESTFSSSVLRIPYS